MRVIEYQIENYMKVRLLGVKLKGRITQITGKNGQGKTSGVRALFDALRGKRSQPEMPVRKGAERARIWAGLGEEKIDLHLRLTVLPNGSRTLSLETDKGVKVDRPQDVLDKLMQDMPGDPLEFMKMPAKQQAEILRGLVKVDVDFDALNKDNACDYEERTEINKQIRRLEAETQSMVVQDGLPKEKLDESEIRAKMGAATETNARARDLDRAKQDAYVELTNARFKVSQKGDAIARTKRELEEAEKKVRGLRASVGILQKEQGALSEAVKPLQEKHEAMPAGELIDVSALSAELDRIQVTNREIDRAAKAAGLRKDLDAERVKANKLTRAMEEREEQKRAAMAKAKMPVDGMTFDENAVLFKGIPLTQLGEAEQLRVCCQVFMSGKSELRILPIWHGEALDEDNLKMLEALCEENDFHILMARVDSSGKVGIVMEDGEGHEAE